MKYKNIIFDFDGVLAESVQIKTEAFHQLYEKYGENIAEKVVEHHKANGGMSRFEKFPYYHKTFLNIDLSKEDIEKLSYHFSNLVVKGVIDADEVPGATWFLKKYYSKMKFWIVSATPTNEIRKIVKARNMSRYFEGVWGSPELKSSIVSRLIQTEKLNNNETIFFGDAMADYHAAEKNNINFLLRETSDNYDMFKKFHQLIRFKDFFELESIFINL